MKFYDREKEADVLLQNWERSDKRSVFTVMMGCFRPPSPATVGGYFFRNSLMRVL